MTINATITAGCFQYSVETLKQDMFDLDFATAISAEYMMVVIPRDLVGQMSIGCIRGAYHGEIRQEFEGSIHRWLGETRKFQAGFFINFRRREMRPFMMKHM